jgi:hypothetical protein
VRFARKLDALEARVNRALAFVELSPVNIRGGLPLEHDRYRASRLVVIPGFRIFGGLPRRKPYNPEPIDL